MDTEDIIYFVLWTLAIATLAYIMGHAFSFNDTTIAPHMYQDIIKPALQDCTHPDYYYQDSHRALCDGLGVNATK